MSYNKMTIRKSASCQMYQPRVISSSSDTSGSSSSWETSDTPLKRFNRILRTSVARQWAYFRKDRADLRIRGRSVSDTGLCSVADNDPDLSYLDISAVPPRRSLRVYSVRPTRVTIPELSISYKNKRVRRRRRLQRYRSAGAGTVAAGVEEASDSDAEKPRRGHHLRVPTPAVPGQSTGNFAAGGAGGGCGAPRSAPSTPLQLDNHPRSKHDKHAVKPLSGSAPSVRVSTISQAASDSAEGSKQPSKARQKKFQRHFPQVGPEERVLNYYSCALVGDLLLQGHLYITKNYFAFYSNVFGYVTKLLIPITSVLRITKEKVARIIPNAVGVCTRDERHVFGSLLSRDATYKLMTHVWKASRAPEVALPKPNQELRVSEADLDASEYSPEDDSSSAGGDHIDAPPPPVKREAAEAIISTAGAAVIQPALLTGGASPRRTAPGWQALLAVLAALLAASAALLLYRLYTQPRSQEDLLRLSGEELYAELVRWRTRLHGRAASELHAFLSTNLLLLTKVRQSLEALSGVILTDMSHAPYDIDVPNDTAFS